MFNFYKQWNKSNLSVFFVVDIIVQLLLKILVFLSCIFVILLIFITCIDVIGRYFLNMPLMGSTELTEITLGLLVFSSIPIITYETKHITVDILDFFIPQSAKYVINIFSYVSIALGFWILADYSSTLIKRTFRRDMFTEYLEIPVGYIMVYAQITCYITTFLMVVLIMKTILKNTNNQLY